VGKVAASESSIYYVIKGGLLTDWWKFTDSVNFNGIIFENISKQVRKYIEVTAGTLNIKWCELIDVSRGDNREGDYYPLIALISSATANVFSNNKVFNCDAGLKFTSNSVQIRWSQFYKQLIGTSVHIIGAGSGIIVNHNDFLYNRLPLKFESNNGSEVVKNNILYYSLFRSMEATTGLVYTNSVDTGNSYNVTPGAQVIRSNPHYINTGYTDLEDINLILKKRELGYNVDSPAIGIADDGYNAGSLRYEIPEATQTWTEITVQKDRIINGYDPVGAIELVYNDGSVESFRSASTEFLKLEWRYARHSLR